MSIRLLKESREHDLWWKDFTFLLISVMQKITFCFLIRCLLKVISHGYEQGKDTLL